MNKNLKPEDFPYTPHIESKTFKTCKHSFNDVSFDGCDHNYVWQDPPTYNEKHEIISGGGYLWICKKCHQSAM